MIRLLWALSTRIRYYLRRYMPTNIALDAIRTRRGLLPQPHRTRRPRLAPPACTPVLLERPQAHRHGPGQCGPAHPRRYPRGHRAPPRATTEQRNEFRELREHRSMKK